MALPTKYFNWRLEKRKGTAAHAEADVLLIQTSTQNSSICELSQCHSTSSFDPIIVPPTARGAHHLKLSVLLWGAEAVVHDVFYFILFISFVFIQAFRVFHSYHLCEQASVRELVCAGAWVAFFLSSLCTHCMCLSMGMKVCCVAFLPLSSPGVVLTLLYPVSAIYIPRF